MKMPWYISETDPRYTGTRQDVRALISILDFTDIRFVKTEKKTSAEGPCGIGRPFIKVKNRVH
jgi:hypothetical protein